MRTPVPCLMLLALAGVAFAQAVPPDLANVPYGPHERNVLDLWKAKSGKPTPLVVHIHGGGFTQGDKKQVPAALLAICLENGVSVASINYRYSTQAPFPAPMRDGARAIQFLRLHAKEWNLDSGAFAATGGSAGAGISLWTGFHTDLADLKSDDPVNRQSTRLSAIGPVDGQSTYDPRVIAKLVDEKTARIQALPTLIGFHDGSMTQEQANRLYEDASPITHLTRNAPPVFMYYSRPMRPLPPADPGEGIHNPRFGVYLKESMDKLGIECVVHLRNEYGENPGPRMYRQMIEFFEKYFAEKPR